MKKFLSVLLTTIILLCQTTVSFASEINLADYDLNRYNELLDYGLSASEATQLLKIENVVDKLETANMTIEDVNGKYQVVNNSNEVLTKATNNVTLSDVNYITNVLKEHNSKDHIAYEEMVEDVANEMQVNPGRTEYRINYDTGSWIKATLSYERIDEVEDDSVNAYFLNSTFPNEVEIYEDSEFISSDGVYSYKCEIEVFDGIYYARCFVEQVVTYSNNGYHVEVNSIQSGQAAAGLITVANASKSINVASTDYYEQPQLWCEVENQVVFTVSGSVGLSLVGTFNFSVNAGNSWTQYAIIRSSLVAIHSYGAYYTVLT